MIVKMKKVRLAILNDERDAFLLAMQKRGLIELTAASGGETPALDLESEMHKTNDTLELLERQKKVAKTRSPLNRKEVIVKEDALVTASPSTKDAITRIDEKNQEIQSLKEEIARLNETATSLSAWRLLTVPLSHVTGNPDVAVMTGLVSSDAVLRRLVPSLDALGALHEVEGYLGKRVGLLVTCLRPQADAVAELLSRNQFTPVELPRLDELPGDAFMRLKKEEIAARERLRKLEVMLSSEVPATTAIGIEADRLSSLAAREAQGAHATKKTLYYEGWIRADREKPFRKALDASLTAYDLELSDPAPDDDVPTCLENNKFVKPFESITNMFSIPSYRERDPNGVMSIWYWLLFGLMVGDLGYGLLMAVIVFLFLRLRKPKGGIVPIAQIILYASITTALSGIFYNSFFGFTLFGSGSIFGDSSIFGTSCVLAKYTIPPMDAASATKLLIFSIIIGMFHLITGLVMKAIDDVKSHDVCGMLAHEASWILIMLGGAAYAAGLALSLGGIKTAGLVMAGTGVGLLVIFSGVGKKGILKKALAVFTGLYGVTSYLSDLLSYTRVMALVMASAAIAYVMNLLAGMVWTIPGLGIVFGILIYIVGHLFNLVLGLLSAYVHDCRLQYIEFYGKFYTGGGHLFQPLAFTADHIDKIHQTGSDD